MRLSPPIVRERPLLHTEKSKSIAFASFYYPHELTSNLKFCRVGLDGVRHFADVTVF